MGSRNLVVFAEDAMELARRLHPPLVNLVDRAVAELTPNDVASFTVPGPLLEQVDSVVYAAVRIRLPRDASAALAGWLISQSLRPETIGIVVGNELQKLALSSGPLLKADTVFVSIDQIDPKSVLESLVLAANRFEPANFDSDGFSK